MDINAYLLSYIYNIYIHTYKIANNCYIYILWHEEGTIKVFEAGSIPMTVHHPITRRGRLSL